MTPGSWETVHLGDICDVLDNKRKPITKRDRRSGPHPYYGASGILDYVDGYIFDESLVLIGEDGAKWEAGENSAFTIDGKTWVNNHAHVLRPHRDIVADKWLVYYLNAEDLTPFVSGMTVPKLNQKSLRSVPIPLPPLPEQRRLVALLDAAFAGLATAEANTRRNLTDARGLIIRHLQRAFALTARDATRARVAELADDRPGSIRTGPFGSQLLHGEFVDDGVAVLGIDNAVQNRFVWGKRRFIREQKYEQLKRYTVRPGDVIITIMGTCGRCAVVPDDITRAINSKHLCCISLDRNKCLPEFLHLYFLHAPRARDYLAAHAKGSIMEGLNMTIIKELPVDLPRLEIQTRLVQEAGDLREAGERLTEIFERKLAALEKLKQSILHRAFRGELSGGRVNAACEMVTN